MRTRRAAAALLSLTLAMTCGRARAQDADALLERGRDSYLEADFTTARDLFRRAMDGTTSRVALVEALRYLATTEGILGDTEAAGAHAALVTSLATEVSAAEGAPAEVVAIFDRERAASERRTTLTWSVTDGATAREVAARLDAELGDLAARVELLLSCGAISTTRPPFEAVVTVPGEEAQACTARARLRDGDVLFQAELSLPGLHPAAVPAPVPAHDDTLWIAGLTIGGVVLVALAITIPILVVSNPTQGEPTSIVIELR